MTKVTNDFSDKAGQAISGADVDQNFSDLTSAIDQITTANISATAGITSSQLADRYSLSAFGPWTILPYSADPDWTALSSDDYFTLPTSATTVLKHKMLVKPGRRAYVVSVEFHLVTKPSATHPTVTIISGGVTLGGGAKNLDGVGYTSLQNSNPIDNPLVILNNADEIEIKIGSSASSPATQAAGLSVTLWIKEELVP